MVASKQTGQLRLGSSSWTAKGWLGSFYPSGTKQGDFLIEYSKHYDTVEIDATFYAIPAARTVDGWRDKTPEDFVFATKVPKSITHDNFLENCEDELTAYLDTMDRLGDKLGPILLQFQYYAKRTGVTFDDFVAKLERFLKLLPTDEQQFAVEVRNKPWLKSVLFDLLAEHNAACTLIDHPWMARPKELFQRDGVVTAPFVYIRWLGDRHGIEKVTKVWNETVVDRRKDLDEWAPQIEQLIHRPADVFGYINNHYGGYAPADIDYLLERLKVS